MSEITLTNPDTNGVSQTFENSEGNPINQEPAPLNAESAPVSEKKSLPVKKGLLAAGFRSQQNVEEPVIEDEKVPEGTQYYKYSIFWVSASENEQIYDIIMEFPGFSTVEDAIKKAIPEFNMKFLGLKKPFRLSDDPSDFQIYHAKKNGKAKLDYPSFVESQNLSQLGVNLLTLKEKNPEKGVVFSDGRKSNLPQIQTTHQPSMSKNAPVPAPAPAPSGGQMKPFEQMTPKSKDYPKTSSSDPLSVQRSAEAEAQKEESGCCSWLSNCLGLNKKTEVDEKRQPVLKNQMP